MVEQVGPAQAQSRTKLALEAAVIDWLPCARLSVMARGSLGIPTQRPEIRLQSAPFHPVPHRTLAQLLSPTLVPAARSPSHRHASPRTRRRQGSALRSDRAPRGFGLDCGSVRGDPQAAATANGWLQHRVIPTNGYG